MVGPARGLSERPLLSVVLRNGTTRWLHYRHTVWKIGKGNPSLSCPISGPRGLGEPPVWTQAGVGRFAP
jgi:hypothetical protein